MQLPIFSSSDGRTVIGRAAGLRSATVTIRRTISIHPRAVLHVWRRSADTQDMLGLPDGWVYSVSYRPGA